LIIVAFGLIGKQLDAKIEASFGITGVVLAILVFTLLGPIQRWIGETAGDAIRDSSKFGLAIAGIFLALKIHSVSNIDDENENFTL
jgi:phosphotransferase system  glucose/maltose/N-acetylglucosamine-specific IIC component